MRRRPGPKGLAPGLALILTLTSSACTGMFEVSTGTIEPIEPKASTDGVEVFVAVPGVAETSRSTAAATVLVASVGGADDAGLDATVATLRQRPDLHVEVIASGHDPLPATSTTSSGFPVDVVPVDPASATAMGIETAFEGRPDLVVVAMGPDDAAATQDAMARTAVAHGVSAVVVQLLGGDDVVDYGAGALHLLDALDAELGDLLFDDAVRGVRMSVPSCPDGRLRGRLTVVAGDSGDDEPASRPAAVEVDCVADRIGTPRTEVDALAAGFVALVELD